MQHLSPCNDWQHGQQKLTFVCPCSVQLRLDLGKTKNVNAVLPGSLATFSVLVGNNAADQQQQERSQAPAAAEMAVAGESFAGAAAAGKAEPSAVVSLLPPSSPAASTAALHAEAVSGKSAALPVTPAAIVAEADAAILLAAAAQMTLSSHRDAAVAVVQQDPAKGPVTSSERIVADGWARAGQPAPAGSPRHPDSAPPKLGMLVGECETPRPQTAGSAELRPQSAVKRTWFPFGSKHKPGDRCACHACARCISSIQPNRHPLPHQNLCFTQGSH